MENNHLLRGFDNWETCARYWHNRTHESQTAHILILKKYNELQRDHMLLESKIEELNEGLTEVRNDYQDICELTGQVCLPNDRQWLAGQVGRENWERFKNHIGW